MTNRARDPESVALFRIVATEAYRFPELAAKVRESSKQRWDRAVADYFRSQIKRGTLSLADPEHAAVMFRQMIFAYLREGHLVAVEDPMLNLSFLLHLIHVHHIFLLLF